METKINFNQDRESNNCQHLSHHDLQLEYVDWEVNTLFIGTFNPGCCSNNKAEWFYGRTAKNMFWDTLGYFYENNPILGANGNPVEWKAFCKRNKIAVTDLIKSINGIDLNDRIVKDTLCKNFSDAKLEPYILNRNAESNQVEDLILYSPKLKDLRCVYLTRATANFPWNILWNPIKQVCLNRNLYFKKLLTPGGYNYYQFNTENFPRIPQNLCHLWINRYGLRDCRKSKPEKLSLKDLSLKNPLSTVENNESQNQKFESNFENLWEKIREYEGKSFRTKRGIVFSYKIKEDSIIINERIPVPLNKINFEIANNFPNAKGPGSYPSSILGPSYVWAILKEIKS